MRFEQDAAGRSTLRLTGCDTPVGADNEFTCDASPGHAIVVDGGTLPEIRAGGAVGLAVAVACSRVLLDLHWVSDVVAGLALGRPMDLVFTPLEVVAVGVSTGAITLVALDGESNWLEGAMLLAVYAVLGVAFYF